jgi:hypothetical protein
MLEKKPQFEDGMRIAIEKSKSNNKDFMIEI